MKRVDLIFIVILFVMAGCGEKKQAGDDGFNTVDVKASFPQKELILQDYMDVEYVVLDSSDDDFLCQGIVLDIGKGIILVRNESRDGDIFVFDRTGKGLRKINRRGGSGQEYTMILGITLDEDNNEMFVNDPGRILVYDLSGNFKRRDIEIAYNEVKSPNMTRITDTGLTLRSVYRYNSIIQHQNNFIITETSSDTIFRLLPDYSMTPFFVRTPSIQTMVPEIFLFPLISTDRYCFMEMFKKEADVPKTNLLYDRQDESICAFTINNGDYSIKTPVVLSFSSALISQEIAFWKKIEAYELIEANEKGELKGKLKEVAAKLDEDSNPVIMLAKYRK